MTFAKTRTTAMEYLTKTISIQHRKVLTMLRLSGDINSAVTGTLTDALGI
ncbi:MAG: hypothetical protein O9293_06090 [Porphyrobacter sp.]|nr:hypothetical protein [Porphyrobacter sp.]